MFHSNLLRFQYWNKCPKSMEYEKGKKMGKFHFVLLRLCSDIVGQLSEQVFLFRPVSKFPFCTNWNWIYFYLDKLEFFLCQKPPEINQTQEKLIFNWVKINCLIKFASVHFCGILKRDFSVSLIKFWVKKGFQWKNNFCV